MGLFGSFGCRLDLCFLPIRLSLLLCSIILVSSSLGPPASCPLPEGAGYATIEQDGQNRARFCHTREQSNQCGKGFECIQSAGQFSDNWDGVCCPLAKG